MFSLLIIYFKGKIQYKLHEKKNFIITLIISKRTCIEATWQQLI